MDLNRKYPYGFRVVTRCRAAPLRDSATGATVNKLRILKIISARYQYTYLQVAAVLNKNSSDPEGPTTFLDSVGPSPFHVCVDTGCNRLKYRRHPDRTRRFDRDSPHIHTRCIHDVLCTNERRPESRPAARALSEPRSIFADRGDHLRKSCRERGKKNRKRRLDNLVKQNRRASAC